MNTPPSLLFTLHSPLSTLCMCIYVCVGLIVILMCDCYVDYALVRCDTWY